MPQNRPNKRGPIQGEKKRREDEAAAAGSLSLRSFFLPANQPAANQQAAAEPSDKEEEIGREGEEEEATDDEDGAETIIDEEHDNDEHENDNVDDAAADKGTHFWPKHTMNWFREVRTEIDGKVASKGRGTNLSFGGRLPQKYCQRVSPSSDPLSFKLSGALDREDFCLPDLLVWFPEAQWPRLYKDCRPPCKWHGCTGCVVVKGWVQSPRHCHDRFRSVALIGRHYVCSARRNNGQPFHFRGAEEVPELGRKRRRAERRPRKLRRCRKCGQQWRAELWIQYHQIPVPSSAGTGGRPQNRNLENRPGQKPTDCCTVPLELIAEGFPIAADTRFPAPQKIP